MYSINSIQIDRRRLHFIDQPSQIENAPIILFLHGFPDNAFGWEHQIEALKGSFHLIAPFAHGSLNKENTSNELLSLNSILNDVTLLLQNLNKNSKKDVYIISHDLGCFLGSKLSLNQSLNIKGLININGLSLPQYVGRKFQLSQWLKSYYILLAQLSPIRSLISRVLPNFFLRLIYNLSLLNKNDLIRRNDKRVLSWIYIYKNLFKRALQLAFKKHQKINVPTTFIWGKDDKFLNHPTRPEAKKYFQRPVIRMLPGGHWILRSNFKHVNRIIESTLLGWQRETR